ncbi:dihydrodipicolinate synthase [Ligilactobacillus acidipiscis DSM 15836]|jgi:4-hydroxy-tetrahydrodipicolinate synthase|uniref:4-hydroxy-tetrahydrodipicolinate synthase n=4 Tax=Ligilactobacillus acidipiscis TaxID=89059 RepID=A0A1K1KPH3_9LACO|nr:4-hydroxy-tetrahydrodipicolinate synthase [Ligilactobacillus acidipiscis]KRM30710.1 dihydrodipicolinate synthase [Ligilactobacillus acidipiscis DSM 15836]MCI1924820.1 4-hydroxy-tetrahydrodipicolinate synthase [Ligilactobacillus acidipiscis]SFV40755.1 4-hydroxy-tetrahydrodipicolinate synthase [Ligilactobacillus acidipiscis]GAW63237.1 N-acetylneuraminate lyase [Ligilactobacillus acidipiscis]GEN20552.1 4-hydroxy-tetrahydrodipicolinate synthase [Ligilactobacillus acidipiscis]
MKNLKLAQIITAMVTPYNENDELDTTRLKSLLEYLLKNGTQGVLINGTTGEGPNLSVAEKEEMIQQTIKIVNDRVPIIAGVGSNSTSATVADVQKISNYSDLSALLVVVPYYNKPDQAGMIAHFTMVADASKIPIVIYNIPGRTGVKMSVDTVLKLAEHPNIIGVKNCTGAADLAVLIQNAPEGFLVYSGEDEDALTVKVLGGAGIISVASHIFGNEMAQMYRDVDCGNVSEAGQNMRILIPKVAALFRLPSPAPVKAALNERNILVGDPRLPILPLDDEQQDFLEKVLSQE